MYSFLENLTLALIPGFLVLDFIVQKRKYDKSRHWRARGLFVTVAIFFFTGEVAAFWGGVIGDFHLLDASGLGLWGAPVAVLVYVIVHYTYHRAAHEWTWLWRAGHQMHHSAESLDAFGAYYLHPFDAAMFATLEQRGVLPAIGRQCGGGHFGHPVPDLQRPVPACEPENADLAGLCHPASGKPQHPPHARGVHRYNYADLPVIDMLFGTFGCRQQH